MNASKHRADVEQTSSN